MDVALSLHDEHAASYDNAAAVDSLDECGKGEEDECSARADLASKLIASPNSVHGKRNMTTLGWTLEASLSEEAKADRLRWAVTHERPLSCCLGYHRLAG